MKIQLHKNARTTLAIRLELQARAPSVSNQALAEAYNLNRHTVAKWRQREETKDASHRPHQLHATLSPAQEAVVVALRKTLLLPLDDRLAVTHEFIHAEVSRSALDRCLRRHGVANRKALLPKEEGAKTPVKAFKAYDPGFVSIDVKYLPQMPDEDQRTYLFAAIDRATRWVYVEIHKDKSATSARGFLNRLIEKAPFKLSKVLTDNGKEFTDRFCATGERQPTGHHAFDRVCADNHIEHRLIKPRTPQTNGMIERFNGRIAEVLTTTRFDSSLQLTGTIKRYVQVYNHHIPQKALGHITPIHAMKNWSQKQPNLFKKRVYNLSGPDALGLRLRIAHYPPYTSKWHPIEHRLFRQIEKTWRGVILDSPQTALQTVERTQTQTGLTVKARLLDTVYELGRKCSDTFRDIKDNFIRHDEVLGKWNYVVDANGFH